MEKGLNLNLKNMLEFKGKTVLITGGGSGIGEAMACQYAMKGTNVILTGRRMETLEKVQQNALRSEYRHGAGLWTWKSRSPSTPL